MKLSGNKNWKSGQHSNRKRRILPKIWCSLFICVVFLLSFSNLNQPTTYDDIGLANNNFDLLSFTTKGATTNSSRPTNTIPGLNLIDNNKLKSKDYFSDSWLLPKHAFLQIPISQVNIVEDACFAAIGKRQPFQTSKMFVDYTEFAVEHMSKWWNAFKILYDHTDLQKRPMFTKTISIFDAYLDKVKDTKLSKKSPLHNTIAMVAFQPYKSQRKKVPNFMGKKLTTYSLGATIASLYRIGFGRVVVVGYVQDEDEVLVMEAFQLLRKTFNGGNENLKTIDDTTELGYVRITNETWVQTNFVKVNMPRGAIIGMTKALTGELDDGDSSQDWLGPEHDASYWKYVYLTEPDTILQTKPEILLPIQQGLDHGFSFFPHRLQPLPHEADLPILEEGQSLSSYIEGQFIPNKGPFSNITILDTWYSRDGDVLSHCCDDMDSGWPGRDDKNRYPKCGKFWWTCGFVKNSKVQDWTEAEVIEHHKRLIPYPMMKLRDGTEVTFGPTEMGRRCIPSKTPCTNKGR